MSQTRRQIAALAYAKASQPLDPDKGWQREDIQVAFMAGADDCGVPRLLTLLEVAGVLAVSVAVVRDLVRFGELAYVHAGRGTVRKHYTFTPEEVGGFIRRHTTREHYSPAPKTARYGTRKRAHELAVERATRFDFDAARNELSSKNDFLAHRAGRLAERKARPKENK